MACVLLAMLGPERGRRLRKAVMSLYPGRQNSSLPAADLLTCESEDGSRIDMRQGHPGSPRVQIRDQPAHGASCLLF